MRNPAAHLQRQWSPFYNRFSSSQSSTKSNSPPPSSYTTNISSLANLSLAANQKVFSIRSFSSSKPSIRLNIFNHQFSYPLNEFIDAERSENFLLSRFFGDETRYSHTNEDGSVVLVAAPVLPSTLLHSGCLSNSIFVLRGSPSTFSFHCTWLQRRQLSDSTPPPQPHLQQLERRRGNKRLWRTEKLIRRRLVRTDSSLFKDIEVSDESFPLSNSTFQESTHTENTNDVSGLLRSKDKSYYRLVRTPRRKTGRRRTGTRRSDTGRMKGQKSRDPVESVMPLTGNFYAGTGSSFVKEGSSPQFSTNGASKQNQQPFPPHATESMKDLKPSEVVAFLNQHIVGQVDAKKAVANALRYRWRRQQLRNPELRDDIACKNILMIGPTGSGKTEIARRMAKILDAPFVKVEATKYTEVGFHGRDVDTIIKDLVELAVRRQYVRLETEFFPQAQRIADEKILQALTGQLTIETDLEMYENLRLGKLDPQLVSVEVPHSMSTGMQGGGLGSEFSDGPSSSSGDFYTSSSPSSQNWTSSAGNNGNSGWRSSFGSSRTRERTEKRTISVKEARTILSNVEFSKMIGSVAKARITQQALDAVEQEGIVFFDEIDKICSNKSHAYSGPDASAEGVQRDLLPLIEGTTISTRYGNVKTDHILFIASGSFHSVKPSDMMAELQGRLPVRVELKPLTEDDFRKILTETRHNLLEQNIALLATEGITLLFEPGAADEIARVAYEINSFVENIGARRLVTVLEKIMEEISFVAPEMERGSLVRITEDVVRRSVAPMIENTDLHKFIL